MPTVDPLYRICTPLGDIVIALRPERAPATCANFVAYARGGRFDATSFYRVLGPPNQRGLAHPIDIVQGGVRYDPIAGYRPEAGLGPIRHESTAVTGLAHRDGVVSMGRFAPGETYGGFFVCIGDQPALDCGGGRFADGQGAAAFGRVRDGMSILRRIHATATADEFPADPVVIDRVVLDSE